ncbi:hypothetical protein SAMN05192530_10366 [Aureimonas jatrophae]|uniref:Entericidin EcnA/B family protein n=1 Tax=Aureimonas jatrophae TaxID=1166073 RepID=A0A1H0GCW6_9HYPH|nr:hypothetical protein SAMN05192530_10366 [Aureimonas jatrophae]
MGTAGTKCRTVPFFGRILDLSEFLVMIRRMPAVIVALTAVMALSACANTVRGVGRDVGNTVEATGQAARDIAPR